MLLAIFTHFHAQHFVTLELVTPIHIREKNEDNITAERHLVLFLAHEFRHMLQWDFCSFLYDVSDKRIAKMAIRIPNIEPINVRI